MTEPDAPISRSGPRGRLGAATACLGSGAVLLVAGLAPLAARQAGLDSPLPIASHGPQLLFGGGVALALGLGILALSGRGAGPIFPPGSHRSIIATTILALLVAGMGALAYLALVPEASPQSAVGFTVVAFGLHGVLLVLIYVQGVQPGFVNERSLGIGRAYLNPGVYAGLVSALAMMLLAFANNLALSALGAPQPQAESLRWLREVPLTQFLVVVASGALVAPVVEELFFRGYIFNAYLAEKGMRTAYLASAVLFGIVHGHATLFPAIFLGGLVLAYAYRRSGTIVAPIVAHVLNNSVAFGSLLLAGDL